MYTRSKTLLGFSSATSTSPAFFIGDFATLSLSIVTATTGSSYTVQMSNSDGFSSAITGYSTVTVITAQGMYNIDPGPRWMTVTQPTSNSSATIIASGAVRH